MPQLASPRSEADPIVTRRNALIRLGQASALAGATLSSLVACGGGSGDSASAAKSGEPLENAPPGDAQAADLETPALAVPNTYAAGLVQPWGLAFLPGEREMLVTEKIGRLRRVNRDGRMSAPLSGVPRVTTEGQAGLLDVAVDTRSGDVEVFLSYVERGDGGSSGVAVARARLAGDALLDLHVIFRATPKAAPGALPINYGSRIVIAPDDTLFVTVGDRSAKVNPHDVAQRLDHHLGKIVRIRKDGSVPGDNPFADARGGRPEIWSYGHRNPQGMALRPGTNELWISEHGPQGGDEVNFVQRGHNYGWPRISYGCEYGARPLDGCRVVGGQTHASGMEQPVTYWAPLSIAPSGIAFCDSAMFRDYQGDLLVGALRGRALWRLKLDGHQVVERTRVLAGLGERIRDVRQGPDGALYVLTDNRGGRILRLAR